MNRQLAALSTVAVFAVACGSPPTENGPTTNPTVTTVTVTSPIGDMMAAGREVQLSASAAGADGGTISTSFMWSSSNDAVATVSGGGSVSGLAPGDAMITASAEGVTGDLTMTVVDVDLDQIQTAVTDAYLARLVDGLSSSSAAAVQQVVDQCVDAVDQGHIINLMACVDAADGAIEDPSTPDETVLFAYLGLYVEHAQRLLSL